MNKNLFLTKSGKSLSFCCAYCNKYVPRWKWISTENRYPSLYEAVLAYHKEDGIVYAYRWLDYPADEENPEEFPAEYAWEYKESNSIPEKNEIHCWSETFIAEDEDITHWMPLPPFPEATCTCEN